jgi:hypothetical protein
MDYAGVNMAKKKKTAKDNYLNKILKTVKKHHDDLDEVIENLRKCGCDAGE